MQLMMQKLSWWKCRPINEHRNNKNNKGDPFPSSMEMKNFIQTGAIYHQQWILHAHWLPGHSSKFHWLENWPLKSPKVTSLTIHALSLCRFKFWCFSPWVKIKLSCSVFENLAVIEKKKGVKNVTSGIFLWTVYSIVSKSIHENLQTSQ